MFLILSVDDLFNNKFTEFDKHKNTKHKTGLIHYMIYLYMYVLYMQYIST